MAISVGSRYGGSRYQVCHRLSMPGCPVVLRRSFGSDLSDVILSMFWLSSMLFHFCERLIIFCFAILTFVQSHQGFFLACSFPSTLYFAFIQVQFESYRALVWDFISHLNMTFLWSVFYFAIHLSGIFTWQLLKEMLLLSAQSPLRLFLKTISVRCLGTT